MKEEFINNSAKLKKIYMMRKCVLLEYLENPNSNYFSRRQYV